MIDQGMALANRKADVPQIGDALSAVSWKDDHIGTLHFKSGKNIQFCVRHPDIMEAAVGFTKASVDVKVTSSAQDFFKTEVGTCQFHEKHDEVITPEPEKPEGVPIFGIEQLKKGA